MSTAENTGRKKESNLANTDGKTSLMSGDKLKEKTGIEFERMDQNDDEDVLANDSAKELKDENDNNEGTNETLGTP